VLPQLDSQFDRIHFCFEVKFSFLSWLVIITRSYPVILSVTLPLVLCSHVVLLYLFLAMLTWEGGFCVAFVKL